MTTTTTPELLHLDPTTIEIGENVRLDPRLDRDFLASIEAHGVLAPVTAVRLEDGSVALRDGQRRTQAARQLGVPTIPVYVHPAEGDEAALRTHRVIEQIVLNDHRAKLTEAERARGINQLLLEGVSPTKVAKELSTTKDAVAAAKVAIDSQTAMSALDTGQLNLMEATSFVEFDGDDAAQAELIRATHEVQRVELSLHERLARAFRDYQNARQQVEEFRSRILSLAGENLKLATEGYRQGQQSYLKLLTVQRTYFEANIGYVNTLTTLWQSATTIQGLLLTNSLSSPKTTSSPSPAG